MNDGYIRQLRVCGMAAFVLAVFSISSPAATDNQITRDTGIYSALSLGTAWAITRRHVVTNYHVVAQTRNLRLVMPNQAEIPLTIVAGDPQNDLAILEITGSTRLDSVLPVAAGEAHLGSQVFTIGYPHPDLMGTSPKLTTGYINALSGIADDPRIYQVSVPVQAGNSGGPLLNMYGEVIAIIASKMNAKKMFDRTGDVPQNVNYAVKIDRLTALIQKLAIEKQMTRSVFDQTQSLEILAGSSLKAVLLIAGDTIKQKNRSNTVLRSNTPEQKSDSPEIHQRRILIYSYAEPGNYDKQEDITGSNTVRRYSENTSKLLQTHILNILDSKASLNIDAGIHIKKIYYQLETSDHLIFHCNKHNADQIVASYSGSNPGSHFRYVSYRIIDCAGRRDYKKEYIIKRDERYDNFGYEMDLHNTFQDFLQKLPPFISMAHRQ